MAFGHRPAAGGGLRLLGLAACLSVLTAGLVGLAATYLEQGREPVPVTEAVRAPEGARVLVRGLLGTVRNVSGGAALASLSDCAGASATVLFESAPPMELAWRLVDLDARVQHYKGAAEFVVASGGGAREAPVPYEAVEADAVVRDFRALLCKPVGFSAPVLWAHRDPTDALALEVGVFTPTGDLHVFVHSDVRLVTQLDSGAKVTLIGVVAASADGRTPVLHVRV